MSWDLEEWSELCLNPTIKEDKDQGRMEGMNWSEKLFCFKAKDNIDSFRAQNAKLHYIYNYIFYTASASLHGCISLLLFMLYTCMHGACMRACIKCYYYYYSACSYLYSLHVCSWNLHPWHKKKIFCQKHDSS